MLAERHCSKVQRFHRVSILTHISCTICRTRTVGADQSLQISAKKSILGTKSAPVTTKPQKRTSTAVRGTERGHKTSCDIFTVFNGVKRQSSLQIPRKRLENNHSPQEKQERIIHNKQKVYQLHKQKCSVNQEWKNSWPTWTATLDKHIPLFSKNGNSACPKVLCGWIYPPQDWLQPMVLPTSPCYTLS